MNDGISRAAAWLASDAADYVTGATLFVDGQYVALSRLRNWRLKRSLPTIRMSVAIFPRQDVGFADAEFRRGPHGRPTCQTKVLTGSAARFVLVRELNFVSCQCKRPGLCWNLCRRYPNLWAHHAAALLSRGDVLFGRNQLCLAERKRANGPAIPNVPIAIIDRLQRDRPYPNVLEIPLLT